MFEQIIVDHNDNVIGYKNHSVVTSEDIYRVSVLWIENKKRDILLAKRVATKKHDPNKWEPAAAGTVEKDETYLENVLKEAKEEIGLQLRPKDIITGPKLFLDKAKDWKFFCQVFLYMCDKPANEFTLQADEVADLRWFSKRELSEVLVKKRELFVANLDIIVHAVDNFTKL